MSAVKRWIYRHAHSSSSSSSSSSSKNQRGRSQSLDVQALERSGIRSIMQSRAAAHQQQLAVQISVACGGINNSLAVQS
ncbi:hypothetical protein CVS40_1177 [Lucilia cuprina]|nr:hypothetical protein CVS40_1177 [Lucilia cuprina]